MATASVEKAPPELEELVEGSSLFRDAMRRFRRNRMARVCFTAALIMFCLCFFRDLKFLSRPLAEGLAPGLAEGATPALIADRGALWGLAIAFHPEGYRRTFSGSENQAPGGGHWMGTDALGRDLFSRVLYGGRISFIVALVGTLVSLIIGVIYGAVAGYMGGTLDNLMMRFVDILYGLPFMFVVILIMALLSKDTPVPLWLSSRIGADDLNLLTNMVPMFVALGLVQWLTMARITRGQVISLREQEFITAARTIGVPTSRIIARHIIPNLLGPIIIYSTLTVPGVMLQESFLSFLGLGIRAPQCSWGSLASDGIQALSPVKSYWWQIVFPCLALAITLFSLNFIGDGLRDALDPKGKK